MSHISLTDESVKNGISFGSKNSKLSTTVSIRNSNDPAGADSSSEVKSQNGGLRNYRILIRKLGNAVLDDDGQIKQVITQKAQTIKNALTIITGVVVLTAVVVISIKTFGIGTIAAVKTTSALLIRLAAFGLAVSVAGAATFGTMAYLAYKTENLQLTAIYSAITAVFLKISWELTKVLVGPLGRILMNIANVTLTLTKYLAIGAVAGVVAGSFVSSGLMNYFVQKGFEKTTVADNQFIINREIYHQ